jgi:surfeit locus 1 family protein
MSHWEFKPSLWPTLAAVAGMVLTLALGNWQLGRGNEKSALAERILAANRGALIALPAVEISAEDVAWRRVEVRGRFEPKYAVFIDNRILHGAAGYHVVMPLKLGEGKRYVLVNRGWVAGSPDRSRLPEVKTPRETLVVRGRAVVPGRRFLELSAQVAEGRVWQNLTLERYREAVPIAIQPFLIQQENEGAPDDGLIREWAPPDLGVDKHYGYAFQWFALSALILIFYLITHVRRNRET